MVDRHQKIIHQGEIDMTSLLPPPQAPIVSTPDPSFEAFMEQRGELLKEYVTNLLKNGRFHVRNLLP
jgi:hypothetical protein